MANTIAHIVIKLPRFHGARLHNGIFCEYVSSLLELVEGKKRVLRVTEEVARLRKTYDELKMLVTMPWSYAETAYIKKQHKYRKQLIMTIHGYIWRGKRFPIDTRFYKGAAELGIWRTLNAKTAAAPLAEQTAIIDAFFKRAEKHASIRQAIENLDQVSLFNELKRVNDEITRLCKSRNEEAGKRLAIKKTIELPGKGPNAVVHTQELRKECAKRLEALVSRVEAVYNVLHIPESEEVINGFLGTIENFREIDKLFRAQKKSEQEYSPDEEEIDAFIEESKAGNREPATGIGDEV